MQSGKDNVNRRYNTRSSSKQIRDESPKRHFPTADDVSHKTTAQYFAEIEVWLESRDRLFKLVKKDDIEGVKELLSTIEENARHDLVISKNQSYYTPLYYVSGWSDAKPNVEMLRLLMQNVMHFPVILYDGYGPSIRANRKEGDLITVYGTKLLRQDGSTYIHDPYSKAAVENVKAFEISYDITAEGQIVNYVSKERPDIAKDLGLTL